MKPDTQSSSKKLIIAYILWLFLGWFGIHRFYIGRFLSGALMLLLGMATIIYNKDILIYTIFRIIWIVSESSDFLVMIQGAFLYMMIPLSTSLVLIFVWWIIDSVLIYKHVTKKQA